MKWKNKHTNREIWNTSSVIFKLTFAAKKQKYKTK